MKTYLVDIQNQIDPLNAEGETLADVLYRLIRDDKNQGRVKTLMRRHPLLDIAAEKKAQDMATNHYFAHTSPLGVSANQNVRNVAYPLPDWYPANGNNVESLYIGADEPEDAAKAWWNSDQHRTHVYAQDEFFQNQNCIGVAYAPHPTEPHYGYWTFISAPCP